MNSLVRRTFVAFFKDSYRQHSYEIKLVYMMLMLYDKIAQYEYLQGASLRGRLPPPG